MAAQPLQRYFFRRWKISRRGRRLVGKGEAKVWSVPDFKEIHHLRKMEMTVESLRFLTGNRLICETFSSLFLHDLAQPGKAHGIKWNGHLLNNLPLSGPEPLLLMSVGQQDESRTLQAITLSGGRKSEMPFGLLPDDLIVFAQDGREYLRVTAADPSKVFVHSSENGAGLYELAASELTNRQLKLDQRTRFEVNNGVFVLENRKFEPCFLLASKSHGLTVLPSTAIKGTSPDGWALSPDGRILLLPASSCSSDNPGQLEIVDVRTGHVTQTLPNESPAFGSKGFKGPGGYSAVAFSPDGKLTASVVPWFGNARLYKVIAPAHE